MTKESATWLDQSKTLKINKAYFNREVDLWDELRKSKEGILRSKAIFSLEADGLELSVENIRKRMEEGM